MIKHLNKDIIIILILAIFSSLLINELNLKYIKENFQGIKNVNSKSLYKNSTIWSTDNISYLPQADNMKRGYGYTIDPDNKYMSVRRTPGYSFIYFFFLKSFSDKTFLSYLKAFQLFLFAISAIAFYLIILHIFDNKRIALFGGILYSIVLYQIGFLYYTITEAIHPEFLVFSIYFFTLFIKKNNNKWLFISGLFLAISVLIRPFNGVLLPFYLIYLIFNKTKKIKIKLKHLVLILFGAGFLMGPWIIRNYIVTEGEFIPLEKFYQEDPVGMGKSHYYFRNWHKSWGLPQTDSIVSKIFQVATDEQESEIWVENYVNNLPSYAFRGYNKNDLKIALRSLISCDREKILENINYTLPNSNYPVRECDEHTKELFKDLTTKYKKADPFRYWVITPLKLVKELILTSNTNALAILNPENRDFNILQIIVKGLMYLLNALLFFSTILLVFIQIENKNLKWILIGFPLCSMFILTFIFRYVETRYILQIYSVTFLNFLFIFNYFLKRISKNKFPDLFKKSTTHI